MKALISTIVVDEVSKILSDAKVNPYNHADAISRLAGIIHNFEMERYELLYNMGKISVVRQQETGDSEGFTDIMEKLFDFAPKS